MRFLYTTVLAAMLSIATPYEAVPLAPLAGKTSHLQPKLVKRLRGMAGHFGKTILVTSGCRTKGNNRGVKNSYHLRCMAADVYIKGVSQKKIVSYWRNNGGGGTGTYGCSNPHVDIGPTRTWHWPCKRKKR